MYKIITLVLALSLVSLSLAAQQQPGMSKPSQDTARSEPQQDKADESSKEDAKDKKVKNCGFGGDGVDHVGWILFPLGFYSEDTDVGFGVTAVVYKQAHSDELITRQNSFTTVFFYTLKNQLLSANVGNLYWFNAKLHWQPKLVVSLFPQDFYGIGHDTPLSNQENFEPFYLSFQNILEYRLVEALYGGIQLTQGWYEVRKLDRGGIVDDYYQGYQDRGFYSGIGVEINRDTRDDSIYPRKGHSTQAAFNFFICALGSQYNFFLFNFDHRSYWSLPLNSVLAWQLKMDIVYGHPPLNVMPSLGGQNLLRGYEQGRYRDNLMIATQIEWRVPIIWRIGGVLFAGAGQVAEGIESFYFDTIKWSLGFGVRISFTSDGTKNFRFDMGFTAEGYKFYFNFLEAF